MHSKSKTGSLVKTALLAALIAVTAQITLPLGAVPFSMAVFGVFFASLLLPPAAAAACIGVYLCMGLAGIPVFAQFKAGPQVLLGPTGGFLIGYFAMGLAAACGAKYSRRFLPRVLACAGGLAVCYLLGAAWFSFTTGAGFAAGLTACVLPFIIPDSIKIILAVLLAHMLEVRLKKEGKGA